MHRKGTILYLTGIIEDWSERDLSLAVCNFNLNGRLCRTATESDTLDMLRLLVQAGATMVEGLCVSRAKDGSLIQVGKPMRLFG